MALLLAFIVAAALLTMTPGVDTAMVLRVATVEGKRSAMAAAAGICAGCLGWGAVVALGLAALLRTSPLAYDLLKWMGAGYLLYLAAGLLWRPRESFDGTSEPVRSGALVMALRGFLTNALNPKMGIFYVTFLPQFIPAGVAIGPRAFLLASIHVALSVLWFAALIGATAGLSRWLRRPAVIAALDRVTGAVFVAFGVRLALSSAR
ncbi:LysE family translocator [Novosphingobium percolationis]|uniref:LysE family translocator n=1 Tax=Novosphingobium percolationis TaxID=2871811 RepID=UPI001CD55776|nr:LysE family translocator [Novosphingobium percolationis]MCH7627191.1 LysE family translocator [Pseudomonadota bacterium]